MACKLSSVQPAFFSSTIIRCNEWQRRLGNRHHNNTEKRCVEQTTPTSIWRCFTKNS